MGCPAEVEIGDNLVFTVCTHDPDTGVLTDADSVPSYRVYEDETGTAILNGSMAKLDDTNTTGFYSESLACTSGNGFENGKSYSIYVAATVDSDQGGISYGFKAYDERKADAIKLSGDSTAADNAELAFDGTGYGFTNCVIPTVTTLTGHTAQTGDSYAYLGTHLGAAGANATEAGGTGDQLSAIPWNASWDAEVQSECNDALVALHLDHVFAVDYDPASKPGVATALLNELVESDAGVSRYTANALEQAPTGGSAPTAAEIVDEWETQSQADPTGFHVNLMEIGGTAQTANDNGADINTLISRVTAAVATEAKQDTIDTVVDAIKAVTDNLPNSGALTDLATAAALIVVDTVVDRIEVDTQDIQSRLPAALVSGHMSSDSVAISGSTDAADKLEASAETIVIGTVSHDNTAASTTVFYCDDITEATADHYNGRIVIFTSGALIRQATDITDYALVSGEGQFTVTALTEAPADNVTFVIV